MSHTSSPQGRDWRGVVLPLAFLALWSLASLLHWVDARLIPSPWQVFDSAWKTITGTRFFGAVGSSLARDLAGFALGSLAGIALGTLLGLSRWAERLLSPTFHTLRQISLFAWIPLLSIWLGYNNVSRVVFIAVSTFYPVTLAAFEGVRAVTRAQVEVARVYGFSRIQLLTRLILPAASPQILAGLHLGLIYAWLATIGAEFLLPAYGDIGVGDTVIKGRSAFNVPLVIFGMLVIGGIGAFFNRVAARIEARALRWRGEAR